MPPQILTPGDLEQFHDQGFLMKRALFDAAEVRDLVAWTDELAARPETPGATMMYFEPSLTEPGRRLLSRIENFAPYHEPFARLLENPRMLQATAELFGEPAVLFKDKINCKLPGADGFKPHQDQQAGWDRYGSLFITVMVPVDRATIENGCLEIAGGHHRRGLVGRMWEPLSEAEMAGMEFVPYPMEPGDAVFFDSFAPHRSAPNTTSEPRRVLYATYNRRREDDQRLRYYRDKRESYPPDCERDPERQYAFRV